MHESCNYELCGAVGLMCLRVFCYYVCFFFFKQKTAYEMRISDWSSDVCSSDLPAQAVLTGDVDVAFAAPTAAAFNLSQQGAPIRVILATQILEGRIVVPADSPIKAVEDLAGKRIGMSRPGSSTHAVVTTLLGSLYGLAPEAYRVVPGNEGQLAQLVTRGDIEAAALPHETRRASCRGRVCQYV